MRFIALLITAFVGVALIADFADAPILDRSLEPEEYWQATLLPVGAWIVYWISGHWFRFLSEFGW